MGMLESIERGARQGRISLRSSISHNVPVLMCPDSYVTKKQEENKQEGFASEMPMYIFVFA